MPSTHELRVKRRHLSGCSFLGSVLSPSLLPGAGVHLLPQGPPRRKETLQESVRGAAFLILLPGPSVQDTRSSLQVYLVILTASSFFQEVTHLSPGANESWQKSASVHVSGGGLG